MSNCSRRKDKTDYKVLHRSGKKTVKVDRLVDSLITKFGELLVNMVETLDKLQREGENLSYAINDFLTVN